MRTKTLTFLTAACLTAFAGTAWADYPKVQDKSRFVQLISGKALKRPLIRLVVTPDGRIEGTGLARKVQGSWTWARGYFCRDLYWGSDALGYNCQEVRSDGTSIRFTSDKGQGDFADFKLR